MNAGPGINEVPALIAESDPSFESLLLTDERLRAFNETVPAGILIVAVEDGRVLFSNRFFNDVLGFEGAGILGHGWRELFVDHDDRERLLVTFIEQGEVRNFELRLRRPDGRLVWGLASLSEIPIRGEDLLLFAFVDITALKEAEEEIRRLANHDSLTGLRTLRSFRDLVEEALARARRDQSEFAILFVDLDRFKPVNDTFGHEAGDFVLKEVAHRLHACVRATDTIGRIGGDEFVVLAEKVSVSLAHQIAARIVAAMERPFTLPAGEVSIGASLGIALYPRHGDGLDSLMKAADDAMYRVKRTTRGALAIAGH
ncbi:sensor domain-containing diguanylate cyclase [Magnetospirillum fulvum]|uniref:Diguanylate cyclase n=1 Tax=Magnetospirillum fulvum MGU-K5 TaxID=1316936 RepID=S9TXL0_MAGFU|nr:sensor domain-containing diguanylate cyclase [Magnetospirillum fulvum]EPY03075.1 diguanylate cyclase [Magnetospirillum fulvum MGU-K5]